ncbi:unnamed protein product [Urochloa decumbens]|uniref:Uncharacterized protein n=1 Tax=Urochloa decumbens TaxID=240449 RepID=A0ABC8YVB1_9POAL
MSSHDLPVFIWISSFPNFISLEPIIKAYIRKQQLASVAISLASVCCFIFLWISVFGFIGRLSCFNWSGIRSAGAFARAAVIIVTAYATLLAVDARYISLAIILIILLAFIGALFVIVSLKGRLKPDEDDNKAGNKTGDVSAASRSDMDSGLLLTAVLPCWVLSFMRHFNGEDLVIYYFLLFLSSSLGELSLLMARLPSNIAPAFEVIHRASLVVVLITAHTMAAELLGDTAVLVCAPEIVTALVWLIIQLGHGGYAYATIRTLEAALRKADIAVLGVVALLTYRAPIRDESDLLSSYMSALVACSFSVTSIRARATGTC